MSENAAVNADQIDPVKTVTTTENDGAVTDAPSADPLGQAVSGPSIGETLRKAREAANLSVSDIALRFKLGAQQVEYIESEQWDRLPGRTFIRGIVRSYARALHLDADALLAGLLVEPLAVAAEPKIVPDSTPVSPVDTPKKTSPRDKMIVAGGLLILLVAILVYFLLPEDFFDESSVALDAAAPTVVVAGQGTAQLQPAVVPLGEEKPAADGAAKPAESAAAALVPGQAAPSTTAAASPSPPPPSAPVVAGSGAAKPPAPVEKEAADKATASKLLAAGAVALKVRFTDTSWVEVRDKTGNVIFSHTGASGSEREVVGMAPLSLHIGNAAGVKLEYKGKPVDLSPHVRNNIGRVKLD